MTTAKEQRIPHAPRTPYMSNMRHTPPPSWGGMPQRPHLQQQQQQQPYRQHVSDEHGLPVTAPSSFTASSNAGSAGAAATSSLRPRPTGTQHVVPSSSPYARPVAEKHGAPSHHHHHHHHQPTTLLPQYPPTATPAPSAEQRKQEEEFAQFRQQMRHLDQDHHQHQQPREPMMVALAGWPQPLFIDNTYNTRSRESSRRESFSSMASDAETLRLRSRLMMADNASSRSARSSRQPSRSSSPVGGKTRTRVDAATGEPLSAVEMVRRGSAGASRTEYRSSPRTSPPLNESRAYPTSSARSSISESDRPFDRTRANAITASQYAHYRASAEAAARRRSSFDPRLAPNVGVLASRGPLAIAPQWSCGPTPRASTAALPIDEAPSPATSSSGGQASSAMTAGSTAALRGVPVEAGGRGAGILVLPAVPEVYPGRAQYHPESSAVSSTMPSSPALSQGPWDFEASAMSPPSNLGGFEGGYRIGCITSALAGLMPGGWMMPGMATEVYPRDPDNPYLWGPGVVPPPSESIPSLSTATSRRPSVEPFSSDHHSDTDSSNNSRYKGVSNGLISPVSQASDSLPAASNISNGSAHAHRAHEAAGHHADQHEYKSGSHFSTAVKVHQAEGRQGSRPSAAASRRTSMPPPPPSILGKHKTDEESSERREVGAR